MEISELLEEAKNRANIPSDYALAKVLGIERQIISQWKSGKSHPSTDNAVKLATLAGLDEMRVIAEIELRTANSEKKREFWKHYIESRGLAACVTLTALGISVILTPAPTDAAVLHLQNYETHKSVFWSSDLYIMRKKTEAIKLIFKALFHKWQILFIGENPAHNYKFS